MTSYHWEWKEAHTAAVAAAREWGRDMGIEKVERYAQKLSGGAFRVFGPLPKPEHRFGHEARCEVVSPSDPI